MVQKTHSEEVVLCHPVRTALGNFNGSLKGVEATTLGSTVVAEVLKRSKLDPAQLSSVVMGNVVQAGNKMNPARQSAVNGGVPVSVPALTVNRVCGSATQAIVNAAQEIWLGDGEAAIAGGMENMDRAPYLLEGGRWGYKMGTTEIYDSMLIDGLHDAFSGKHSGWHTEDMIAQKHISREAQDAWAARSQQRYAQARAAGDFQSQIAAVTISTKAGPFAFTVDETPRPDTSIEILAKLKPAFRPDGTLTAGNSPGLNSGAAAMIVASRVFAEANNLDIFGKLVSYGIAANEPGMFALAPVPAVHMALDRAGWTISDLDRVEINEAYAAVPLAVMAELGLPEDIVNVDGGAIAHGHPIGATGAILMTRLLYAMRKQKLRRGLVTLCIGGGQGIALCIEAP